MSRTADMGDYFNDTQRELTRRRSLEGECLVTPTKEIVVDGERLVPGRDRFGVGHEWVQQRPELFTPCMSAADDPWTAEQMRSLWAETEAALIAERDAPVRSNGQEQHRALRLP